MGIDISVTPAASPCDAAAVFTRQPKSALWLVTLISLDTYVLAMSQSRTCNNVS